MVSLPPGRARRRTARARALGQHDEPGPIPSDIPSLSSRAAPTVPLSRAGCTRSAGRPACPPVPNPQAAAT